MDIGAVVAAVVWSVRMESRIARGPGPPSIAPDRFSRIYAVVSRVPRGRVATYGQVARLAGLGGQARLVGYALAALGGRSRVPWHRVVNAAGRISLRHDGGPEATVQRLRLERERVRFDERGAIRLEKFRWRPR
jgi:methylated-DNA-protein-cysteine methyltransferase-like protein